MGWPREPLVLPDDLKTCITSGKCVAFIGSGASAGANCYPTWPELVNSICQGCGINCQVSDETSPPELLAAAENAKTTNQSVYYQIISSHFGKRPQGTSLLYRALLALPFQSYLTTNFDPLLAIESVTNHKQLPGLPRIFCYPKLDRRDVGAGAIHYLHGYVEIDKPLAPNTIVLATSEFEHAYGDGGPTMNIIVPTFDNDAICFVGCRLREPSLVKAFEICERHKVDRIKLLNGKACHPPKKYILAARPEIYTKSGFDLESSRHRLLEEVARYAKLGITAIWYSADGKDHTSLQIALEDLANISSPKVDFSWENGE